MAEVRRWQPGLIENTTGRNESSIELSHGRIVACHKIYFHIKPEKRWVDLYEGLAFFSSIWGENLGGVDLYVQSTCT